MSDPVFWEKLEKKNIINLLSAEFAHRVVKSQQAKAVVQNKQCR